MRILCVTTKHFIYKCMYCNNCVCIVVQELTALHEVLTKERTEHEQVVKGLKQELLTTNNR